MKKYEGEVEPEALGPEGRERRADPDRRPARSGRRQSSSDSAARRRSRPRTSSSSAPTASSNSAVAAAPAAAATSSSTSRKPLGDYIRFSSIRGFKGLESPVVILCELEDIDDETIDQQLYVGFSRARNHCVVVAPG